MVLYAGTDANNPADATTDVETPVKLQSGRYYFYFTNLTKVEGIEHASDSRFWNSAGGLYNADVDEENYLVLYDRMYPAKSYTYIYDSSNKRYEGDEFENKDDEKDTLDMSNKYIKITKNEWETFRYDSWACVDETGNSGTVSRVAHGGYNTRLFITNKAAATKAKIIFPPDNVDEKNIFNETIFSFEGYQAMSSMLRNDNTQPPSIYDDLHLRAGWRLYGDGGGWKDSKEINAADYFSLTRGDTKYPPEDNMIPPGQRHIFGDGTKLKLSHNLYESKHVPKGTYIFAVEIYVIENNCLWIRPCSPDDRLQDWVEVTVEITRDLNYVPDPTIGNTIKTVDKDTDCKDINFNGIELPKDMARGILTKKIDEVIEVAYNNDKIGVKAIEIDESLLNEFFVWLKEKRGC